MKTGKEQRKRIITVIIAIAIPLLVGGFSAFLTAGDMDVYDTVYRPPLAPPGWVFPIVWTILYGLMGFASFLVCTSEADPEKKRKALRPYIAQLVMNFFWSTLFFTYERFTIALLWLLVMWVLVLICAIRFFRIRRTAGLMMGGLLLWTSFAAYLNIGFIA